MSDDSRTVDYERLGAFYLGKRVGPDGEQSDDLLLYDAKDLTTHALVVGMTGSGKTGLSVGVLEEAAIDGVPALVIDPKGDLGNLLLTFPDLDAESFEPWIDPADATRAGKTPQEFAESTADLWRNGLASWHQSPDRIQRFRDATDMTIYTPGASMGVPLSVMGSFDAPSEVVRCDPDALRERVDGATSGLLALLGIEADPVQSREYILLANLMQRAWSEGRDLDLGQLILEIQKPPFEKLGVIDLETFYPGKDRVALAMKLNGLLASPGFAAWLEGEPLDVERLLYRPDGRPRISIVSIAHLSDAERMFVVTLLLNEVVSWMRAQSGTSSLRAILYMDEIYGYFPPTRNPPSKPPMLTLLKQARAFGLGCMLATQNPVDLDYKGLSNCGTWFIGRLQTEQDKNRVLDGLESAMASAGGVARADLSRTLGSLGKRVFLLNNVHEDGPELFQTRWVLSYLRGPLVRDQIARLMEDKKAALSAESEVEALPDPPAVPSSTAEAQSTSEAESTGEVSRRPVVDEGVTEGFAVAMDDHADEERLVYRPSLFARAQLHYRRATYDVDEWQDVSVTAPLSSRSLGWKDAVVEDGDGPTVRRRPVGGASYDALPSFAQRARSYSAAEKKLKTHLYRERRLVLFRHGETKLTSAPGETESEFRKRLHQKLAEERDLAVEKLRSKYASKVEAIEKRIATAQERLDREESQLRDRKLQTAISFGASLLGAVVGRKLTSTRNQSGAARALREIGRTRREGDDVERAEERLEDLIEEKEQLEAAFESDVAALRHGPGGSDADLERVEIPLLKTDLVVRELMLLWRPWAVSPSGIARCLTS